MRFLIFWIIANRFPNHRTVWTPRPEYSENIEKIRKKRNVVVKKRFNLGCKNNNEWMDNSVLQLTPILLVDRIRVFVGIRDKNGVGRVGYVDVDKECRLK